MSGSRSNFQRKDLNSDKTGQLSLIEEETFKEENKSHCFKGTKEEKEFQVIREQAQWMVKKYKLSKMVEREIKDRKIKYKKLNDIQKSFKSAADK